MKKVNQVILKTNSREELLPGYSEKFQHISSYVELDKHSGGYVPWHWHHALELFYVKSGSLEYHTPNGRIIFHEGSGGLINANILHMTKLISDNSDNVQLIHLFDPTFIAGEKGNLIDCTYVRPLVNDLNIELLILSVDNPKHREVLELLRKSFDISEKTYGYELLIRQKLSEIWLKLLEISNEQKSEMVTETKFDDRIKHMMLYIHEHYTEKISIKQLASDSFISERACYRLFQNYLHMTPSDYIKSYRLQIACQMLVKEKISVSQIGLACGLGSGSYFGKQFKEEIGCTPAEYRRMWQNIDK